MGCVSVEEAGDVELEERFEGRDGGADLDMLVSVHCLDSERGPYHSDIQLYGTGDPHAIGFPGEIHGTEFNPVEIDAHAACDANQGASAEKSQDSPLLLGRNLKLEHGWNWKDDDQQIGGGVDDPGG